jgi:hypothetical protein
MSTDDPFAQPSHSPDPESGDAAYSFDGKPDQYGRYRLPDPVTGKATGYTRATTFAKSIADTFALNRWGERMVAKGISMRPDLLAAVAATDLEDKKKLNSLATAAKEAAGAKVGANLGTALHAFTEQRDRGEKVTAPEPWDRDVAAYAAGMANAGITIEPGMIEQTVLCLKYGIAGTFDRLGFQSATSALLPREAESVRRVIDLKTGRDLQYGWLEIAVQLAIYANADFIYNKVTKEYEPMPPCDRETAIVAHLPVGEGKLTIYEVDIAKGWQIAELCYRVRNARKVSGLAKVLEVVDASQTSEPIVSGPTLAEQIDAARTPADLIAIRRDAMIAKTWTELLNRRALKKLEQINADVPV